MPWLTYMMPLWACYLLFRLRVSGCEGVGINRSQIGTNDGVIWQQGLTINQIVVSVAGMVVVQIIGELPPLRVVPLLRQLPGRCCGLSYFI